MSLSCNPTISESDNRLILSLLSLYKYDTLLPPEPSSKYVVQCPLNPLNDLAAQLQIRGILIERDSISRMEIGTRFVADYELRELAIILKVTVNWLLGIE